MYPSHSYQATQLIKKLLPPQTQQIIRKIKQSIDFWEERVAAYLDSTDVYIVSYPNSGRTWLRVLLGKALCEQYQLNEKQMLDTRNLTKAANLPITEFTHDCSLVDNDKFYTTNNMYFDSLRYRNKKVILLIRDPRDVMVSYYFQQSKRDKHYNGSISDFVRDQKFGIEKLIKFNQLWYDNRQFISEMLVISYEQLRKDTSENLKKMLEFMGVQDLQPQVLERAIDFASLNNMQKLEKENYWHDHSRSQMVQARDAGDKESYKARRGKMGGYVDYLNPEDIQFIDQIILKANCPFYTCLDINQPNV